MALLDDEELLPFFGNPNIQRQGARARALAAQRDVNTLPDPRTYAALSGLLGTAPDQMGFSVLNPQYQAIQNVARPAYGLGLAAQLAPFLAPLTKGLPVGASIKNVGKKNIDVSLNEASNFLSAKSEFGQVGGTIRPPDRLSDKPYLQINYAEVEKASRGTGKGKELYQSLIDDAQARGLRVFSDSTVEKSAVNVYKSLGKKDYQLKDMTRGSLEDGAVYGAGARGPAFEILPKQSPQAPQQAALDLAQQRAALPVEQGGLGLLGGNTAEQRAKAMGFIDDFAHGSPQSNITKLTASKTGAEGPGIYATSYFPESGAYAGKESGATVYPLKVKTDTAYQSGGENPYMKLIVNDDEQLLNRLQRMGKESIIKEQQPTPEWLKAVGVMDSPVRDHFVSMNPDLFRSRFAAFDPFRRSAAVAATMGAAAPDLLAAQQDEEMRKLQQLGLLGMVAP